MHIVSPDVPATLSNIWFLQHALKIEAFCRAGARIRAVITVVSVRAVEGAQAVVHISRSGLGRALDDGVCDGGNVFTAATRDQRICDGEISSLYA